MNSEQVEGSARNDLEPETEGNPPLNAVRNDAYTISRHTINGGQVQRDLRRGREAHIFNENENLSTLENNVWAGGIYQGKVRGWYRWTYLSETPIGRRIQTGKPDVELYAVEIKGRFRDSRLEYHLVPRLRAAQ